MDESEITICLYNWLTQKGWSVISVHYPGATSSGFAIKKKNAPGKGIKGSVIPDIVAEKGIYKLIAETRPHFNGAMLKKVEKTIYCKNYEESLTQVLNIEIYDANKIIIGKAIHADSRLPNNYNYPRNTVIFKISENGVKTITNVPRETFMHLFIGTKYKPL